MIRRGSGLDLGEAVFEPILPSPALFDYRNKMEFAFGGEAGAIKLGLRGRSMPGPQSHKRTVGLDALPHLRRRGRAAIFPADPRLRRRHGSAALRPAGPERVISAISFCARARRPAITWPCWSRGAAAAPTSAAGPTALRAEAPRVKSVWSADNDSVADLVDLGSARLESGAAFIEEELGGLRFRIYPDSFFQPNPRGALLFYERIAARVRDTGAKRALGLFCGSGSIELFLAGAVDEVVGIDSGRAQHPQRRGERRPQRHHATPASSPDWSKRR